MAPIGINVPKGYQSHYAQGYNKDGKAVPPESMGLYPAADSIKASGRDMLKFLHAALALPGTPSSIITAMHMTQTAFATTDSMAQGLGWVIYPMTQYTVADLLQPPAEMNMGPLPAKVITSHDQQFNSNALIDKTGTTNGFRAYIALIPQQKSGIVILTNRYVDNGEIVKTGREILFSITTPKS